MHYENMEDVKNWPSPTDNNQPRSFLALCTYYRSYITGIADIAKPLTRLTLQKRTFV